MPKCIMYLYKYIISSLQFIQGDEPGNRSTWSEACRAAVILSRLWFSGCSSLAGNCMNDSLEEAERGVQAREDPERTEKLHSLCIGNPFSNPD